MTAELDGFSAPLTAGNFLDLAAKGFYNKNAVASVDESTVVFGDPAGEMWWW
jgi:peptidylprolyl isomerase